MVKNRSFVADVVPLLAAALLTAAPFALASKLPDPVAMHWGFRGQPNGSLPLVLFAGLSGIIIVIAWWHSRPSEHHPDEPRAVGVAYSAVGLSAAVSALILWANHGVLDWHQARSFHPLILIGIILGSLAAGAWIGIRMERSRRSLQARDGRPRPSVGLRGGERVAYIAEVRASWMILLAIALSIMLAIAASGDVWPVIVLVLVVLTAFSSARVTITTRSIDVAIGPWRWPRKRIPMEDVTGATVDVVRPMRYGGWGYRIGPRERLLVLRSGPALRIETSGKDFVVTMPEPDIAAGVINDLVLDGRRPGTGR